MCLAVPGRIIEASGDEPILRRGRIEFGGVVKEVSLAYVPEAAIGDYVLVHAGFAISIVDEAEAEEVFALLREIDEVMSPGENPA